MVGSAPPAANADGVVACKPTGIIALGGADTNARSLGVFSLPRYAKTAYAAHPAPVRPSRSTHVSSSSAISKGSVCTATCARCCSVPRTLLHNSKRSAPLAALSAIHSDNSSSPLTRAAAIAEGITVSFPRAPGRNGRPFEAGPAPHSTRARHLRTLPRPPSPPASSPPLEACTSPRSCRA